MKFELKQVVKLTESAETGTIIARAEYSYGPPQYQVRYVAADGCQVEAWWTEDALTAA